MMRKRERAIRRGRRKRQKTRGKKEKRIGWEKEKETRELCTSPVLISEILRAS